MAHVYFYVCCSNCLGYVAMFVVLQTVFFSLVLMYGVCLYKGCDGYCVSGCIVTCGAVGTRVWKVLVFCHADVVCLCLVCVLCQISMLNSA